MNRRRALTLVETIIALFILTSAFIIIVQCFHFGMTQQARTEKRMMATQLARKKLAELRAWARTPVAGSVYNYDSGAAAWSSQVGTGDPAYPAFNLTVSVANHTVYSPCSTMEEPYKGPPDVRRTMSNSFKKVKLSVGDSLDASFLFSLVTLVGDPTRDLAATNAVKLIPVSAIPASLPGYPAAGPPVAGSFLDFRAEAYYPDGRVVPDLFFDWYVVPLGGTGTVFPSRDGRTAQFINAVDTGAGLVNTQGKAVVALHGQYRGQGEPPQTYNVLIPNPYITISPVLNLGP